MSDFVKLYNHVQSTPVTRQFALTVSGSNAQGYCPFCEGSKFTVKVATGEARCWSAACGVKTNIISYITKYHEAWLEYTTDEQYAELSKARGISKRTLKRAKLAFDSNNDRWLVPYKNPNTEFLNNLGNFRTYDMKNYKAYRIFVMPKEDDVFPKKIYNPFNFTMKSDFPGQPLIFLEGEWDCYAMADIVEQFVTDFPGERKRMPKILGIPGAEVIPDGLSNLIKNYKDVWLCTDNDLAGTKCVTELGTMLAKQSFKVKYYDWSKSGDHPEGYDIRDLHIKSKVKFMDIKKCLTEIEVEPEEPEELISRLNPGQLTSVAGIDPVENLDTYFKLYGKYMKLNEINRNAIIASFAVSVGTMLPGEALWAFLIGTASSGKTTWIESTGGSHEWCEYASKITAKNLVSGWGGKDPSMLPQMNGKAFMIKDFTTVLGMNPTDQKELFDLLRDVYDGSIKITFGNGEVRIFNNLNFSMLAGVTPAIYKMNDSQLGARFLRIDYSGHVTTDDDVLHTAIRNFGKSDDKKIDLTKATVGYMKHIRNNMFDPTNLPEVSDGGLDLIANLARYVAVLRTKPEHNRSEGLIYRPRPEDPPRLALQFTKLAFAGHKVWHPTQKVGSTLKISDELEGTLLKVAYDTCYGFGQDIVKAIYEEGEVSEGSLQSKLSIPAARVHRVCADLRIVGLVNRAKTIMGRGRPTEVYRINSNILPIMDKMYNAIENQDQRQQ
jgi:predicted transcriptional regulator